MSSISKFEIPSHEDKMRNVLAAADAYEWNVTRFQYCEEIYGDCSNEKQLEFYLDRENAYVDLLSAVRIFEGRSPNDLDSYR